MLKVQSANSLRLNKVEFKPVVTKDYELLVGYGKNDEPIIIDMNKNPHLMIIGDVGSGKSKALQQILTNIISNKSNTELFISQTCMPNLIMFEKYTNIKQFSKDFKELNFMLDVVIKELNDRKEQIKDMIINLKGENIEDYNKLNENKMNYIYVIIDNYENLKEFNTDNRIEKELKRNILNQIINILQFGRTCGVQLVLSNNPHGVFCNDCRYSLALTSNKLLFRINDEIISRTLIGHSDASRLNNQCFILKSDKIINGRSYNIEIKDIAESLNKN